jgi:serine/threonine-protein kinase RsbW
MPPADPLLLDSTLADMARLPDWIDSLAAAHHLPETTRFAMQLTLEEAVANVIRHAYQNQPGHPIAITCTTPTLGRLLVQVDDQAPLLDPLALPARPAIGNHTSSVENIQIGGQGIRLMREFTSALAYEALPNGNRLLLTFTTHNP